MVYSSDAANILIHSSKECFRRRYRGNHARSIPFQAFAWRTFGAVAAGGFPSPTHWEKRSGDEPVLTWIVFGHPAKAQRDARQIAILRVFFSAGFAQSDLREKPQQQGA
jgi:hypothetical protein